MHYLIGLTGKNKKEDAQFYSDFKLLLSRTSKKITEAYSPNSLLSYLAIDHFDALWIRWSFIKNYYTNFYRRLELTNNKIPLIIIYSDKQIDGEICRNNDLIFSLLPEKNLDETIPSMVERIRSFNQFKQQYDTHNSKDIRPNGYLKFVGNDEAMLKIYSQIIKVAKTDFSVLILGQSGSGKEIVAKSIHQRSHRRKNPFISLNCAAIPDNLLESELFGYEKGAFTGAQKAKEGKFELANKGTIFLDEIGDLALSLQGKLLRVLEDHTIERLGSTIQKKVDIRLLAATNKNLTQLAAEGKFRSDLYHRLNVIPLKLPPIRDRGDDVILLILHLISRLTKKSELKVKSISNALIDRIRSFQLDGNVRELENIMTRLIFYSDNLELDIKDIDEITHIMTENTIVEIPGNLPMDSNIIPLKKMEKTAIINALKKLNGNVTKAADALQISRGTLYNKMKEYDLS